MLTRALLMALLAVGAQAATPTPLEVLQGDVDTVWVMVCGIIVFMMQLGFCFLEAGAIRAQNVTSIMYKNFADCCIGAIMWWLFGYSFAYAGNNEFIGGDDRHMWALSPNPSDELYSQLPMFFLSFTYMTTAATIVSGAVAERVNLIAYAGMVVIISGFTYPVAVHWMWSSYGWLSPFSPNKVGANGVLDFAGSVVLHMFGGCCALVFAFLLGPRKLRDGIDVFSEEGLKIVAPHNRLLQAAGTLVLWFSWFAFNAGSVGAISGGGSAIAANACVTTLLSAASCTITCMIYTRLAFGYFDVGHCCNAALAGLVSITAGCAYMSPVYAFVTGIVGFWFYYGIYKLRIKLRIDDVVDAGAVHYGGGVWGGIAVGLFADVDRVRMGSGNTDTNDYGLFLGGGGKQFGMQLLGIVAITAWCVITTTLAYFLMNLTIGARLSEEIELIGIDEMEHGGHAFDYLVGAQSQVESHTKLLEETSSALRKLEDFFDALSKGDAQEQAAAMREAMSGLQKSIAIKEPNNTTAPDAEDPTPAKEL
eukprot:TRINITY_DN652_c0_g1_i2.p1 TRINITY_DN652_c0_g1~~TRINITY_DN652_c0_g1_i2.p1  ORF type:complete len:534 (+),score=227.73 TRINITY_DN652_c0_g1_i2:74-1675(+)